ncbi:hypothetical protein DRN43_00945 [Thermococci archaeon]|uniref:hypothetical protein n=1 Tax=Palaeococcus sp. (in: euryarchaeotes) TaxID=2820298 RepID=UPI000F29FFE9|nr:hypothetical protein [Palaeococcus sp. (in: euryarchaeotes)]MCD6559132.1 hypothetical protein [Palaeococcus sp. (in: euryarchaeotes)]RLF75469.1 MAG: hypothetical protein DRN39_07240 [Thermococci archaeon]RLF90870.1 MAG: hypothetical protein DRN43_00945 [Thermococci archaeon]
MEDEKILLNYYMMTVPHVTVLSGAILGLLLLLRLDVKLALGLFSIFYGTSLTIIAMIVRPQFGKLGLYRISLLGFISLILMGLFLILPHL